MTIWLNDLGHEVRAVERVDAALQAARTWHFDVLLSDIELPDGNGRDLVEQLKKTRQFHALAISGSLLGPAEREKSRRAGFAAHLEKPFNPVDLVRSLEEAAA